MGEGNSCVVYKVCKDNQFYALKRYHLNPKNDHHKTIINYQFVRETEFCIQNISHKNILKVYESNKENKYIITELARIVN